MKGTTMWAGRRRPDRQAQLCSLSEVTDRDGKRHYLAGTHTAPVCWIVRASYAADGTRYAYSCPPVPRHQPRSRAGGVGLPHGSRPAYPAG